MTLANDPQPADIARESNGNQVTKSAKLELLSTHPALFRANAGHFSPLQSGIDALIFCSFYARLSSDS